MATFNRVRKGLKLTQKQLPPDGRYLVVREFSDGSKDVYTALLVTYKGYRRWATDHGACTSVEKAKRRIGIENLFPFDNVIGWMELPTIDV